jgi:hypothetical protein
MDGVDHCSRERELGKIIVEHLGGIEKGQASIHDQIISEQKQLASDLECNWYAGNWQNV